MKNQKFDCRFEMRLDQVTLDALEQLRAAEGLRSSAEWIRVSIRETAKRKGCWNEQ